MYEFHLLSGFAVLAAVSFTAAGYFIFSRKKYRGTLDVYVRQHGDEAASA